MDFCIYTIYHFGTDKDVDQIYYQDGCRDAEVRISDRDIKKGKHMIYYWSDLKPKTIKEENELNWIKDVEPKLTKGLILCPNHEKFVGGCLEILKVDKRRDRHTPDKLVYLQSLETGKRYANTLKKWMQWLSDGEYVIKFQPLKESDDLQWIIREELVILKPR